MINENTSTAAGNGKGRPKKVTERKWNECDRKLNNILFISNSMQMPAKKVTEQKNLKVPSMEMEKGWMKEN